MSERYFSEIMSSVELLPENLLRDNLTYLAEHTEGCCIHKYLILTNSSGKRVGGILNAGSDEIYMIIFPEFRGMHYMSNFFRTGIFHEVWPECKAASIVDVDVYSSGEFRARLHLLELAGLRVRNKGQVLKWIKAWEETEEYEQLMNQESDTDEDVTL